MTTYTTQLEAREEIADGTMAFQFRKPHGFEFKPGQAIDVVLSSHRSVTPDDHSARHAFSIVRKTPRFLPNCNGSKRRTGNSG